MGRGARGGGGGVRGGHDYGYLVFCLTVFQRKSYSQKLPRHFSAHGVYI